MRDHPSLLWLVIAASIAALACGGKSKPAANPKVEARPADADTGDRQEQPPRLEATVTDAEDGLVRFDPIYFEFDSDELSERSRATLEEMAAYLKKNPGARIRIGGHTDERGTTEYNLALGDRRARAARDYLLRLGASDAQIAIITFGEERPAAPGSDETAWSKNRRDEFEVTR